MLTLCTIQALTFWKLPSLDITVDKSSNITYGTNVHNGQHAIYQLPRKVEEYYHPNVCGAYEAAVWFYFIIFFSVSYHHFICPPCVNNNSLFLSINIICI